MKKALIVTLILILVFTAFSFSACEKDESTVEPGDLLLQEKAGVLSWNKVEGASFYWVVGEMPDGSGFRVKQDTLSYVIPTFSPGDYSFYVLAVKKDGSTLKKSDAIYIHVGKGSSADPITVADEETFLSMTGSREVTFGANTVKIPIYYRLTEDLDLTDRTVTPISDKDGKAFRGVFDGNGHKIKGVTLTKSNTNGIVGLFAEITNAVIKNLTLEDASLRIDKNSEASGNDLRFGLLVGSATASFVDNCHVKGDVNILPGVITTGKVSLSAGGIIGQINSGKISSCSFEGSIKAQYARVFVGGIVGEAKGSSPQFTMVNCKANADVVGTATGYDVTSGVSRAISRVGVVAGIITTVSRLSSILALGSADAKTTRDGTSVDDITAGVFGSTPKNSNNINSAPMYRIFYSSSIPAVSATAKSLGTYADNIYPLSDSALTEKSSYLIDEDTYGLDFDSYWVFREGEVPDLARKNGTDAPAPLELEILFDAEKDPYTFSLEETLLPSIHPCLLETTTQQFLGYKIKDLFSTFGIDYVKGSTLVFSAEGVEPLEVTLTSNTKPDLYLVYGDRTPQESEAILYSGYKIINSSTLKTYDFTEATHLKITILPPEEEK